MCGHLQPRAAGTGLGGSSAPLNLFLLQLLKSWSVSLLGHWLLIAAWKISCGWQIQRSIPGTAKAGSWLKYPHPGHAQNPNLLGSSPIPAIWTMTTCWICGCCGEWTRLMQQWGSGKGCINCLVCQREKLKPLKKPMDFWRSLHHVGSPCRNHMKMGSSTDLQDVSPQCRTPAPGQRPVATSHWCQLQAQRTWAVPVRCPTGNKAKDTGEVDVAMQRDKLVLSQLLKTIGQEEDPTLNVAPNKKTKSSSRKLFWGKMTLPAV